MKILELSDILAHCRIDDGEENDYVTGLGDAAEEIVEEYLNRSFGEIACERGGIPRAIRHACYLIVADLYKNREASSTAALYGNGAVQALLRPFRKLA